MVGKDTLLQLVGRASHLPFGGRVPYWHESAQTCLHHPLVSSARYPDEELPASQSVSQPASRVPSQPASPPASRQHPAALAYLQ